MAQSPGPRCHMVTAKLPSFCRATEQALSLKSSELGKQTPAGLAGTAVEGGDNRGNRHKPPSVFWGRALHKSFEHDDVGCTQYNDLKRELALLDETTLLLPLPWDTSDGFSTAVNIPSKWCRGTNTIRINMTQQSQNVSLNEKLWKKGIVVLQSLGSQWSGVTVWLFH